MRPLVSLNGQVLDQTSAVISAFDRGFLLGDGIFETLRATGTAPWYLSRHLDRLRRATKRVGLAYPAALETWIDAILRQAAEQTPSDVALRMTITRGGTAPQPLAGIPANTAESPTSTVVITVSDLPLVPAAAYEQGLSAHIASGIRNERGLLTGIKSTSYMESIVALRDARQAGFDDAIFLDTQGFIAEATASNVFAIIDDVVVTPAITHGILPGITRAIVLELAQQLKIPAVERELNYQELINASEAFLTSSLRGIVPLVRVNDATIGRGTPDIMTHRIMAAYATQTSRI